MFLKVEYDLLRCENYVSAEKLLISYFYSLKQANRTFWGSSAYLASMFGTSSGKMEKFLDSMVEKNLIIKNNEGIILAQNWSEIIRKGQIQATDND